MVRGTSGVAVRAALRTVRLWARRAAAGPGRPVPHPAGAPSGPQNLAADPISNTNWSAWRVNYRLNGGAWHAVAISPDEVALMNRAGSYIFSVGVSLAELRNGANTVQFSGTNFYAGFQPYIANIDLVVQ